MQTKERKKKLLKSYKSKMRFQNMDLAQKQKVRRAVQPPARLECTCAGVRNTCQSSIAPHTPAFV